MSSRKSFSVHYCVLDDELLFLEQAKRQLKANLPKQYKSHFILNGKKAYAVAKKYPLTLFIIDIHLGDEDGIVIFDEIKKISPHARVIFVTGEPTAKKDPILRKRALKEGGVDFITKPVEWIELAIKIRNHMELMNYQHTLEEQVQERTNMLIHADRLATVGTMVSSIVHEVSTPLTFIKANQEISLHAWEKVESKIKDPEVIDLFQALIRPSLEDSLQGVLQIESLLSSFRKFYKKETRISQDDILSVLKDVETLTTYAIKKHNILLTVENRLKDSFIIKCNKQELLQIITNIMMNAVDALGETSKNNRRLSLVLEKHKKTHIVLTISNNGPAIPNNNVTDVFEPFFTTKLEDAGTGLGLYIVRQILQKIGGDIRLNNKTSKKPTVDFVLTIPILP